MKYENCERYEQLLRDDGVVLGSIMRFHECASVYAIGKTQRLGAFGTLEAARAAVEQQRLAFEEPGSAITGEPS